MADIHITEQALQDIQRVTSYNQMRESLRQKIANGDRIIVTLDGTEITRVIEDTETFDRVFEAVPEIRIIVHLQSGAARTTHLCEARLHQGRPCLVVHADGATSAIIYYDEGIIATDLTQSPANGFLTVFADQNQIIRVPNSELSPV